MIKIYKGTAAIIALLFFSITLKAQPGGIPPSADAASVAEYGNVPVSPYTGIPSISIPLWNLEGRKLSVPVSVNYRAGGIRVSEVASRVGLGWSLHAGGVITRTVYGNPDEKENGYLHTKWVESEEGQTDSVFFDFLTEAVEGDIDTQPDAFSFSYPGSSGSFVLDTTGTPRLSPYRDIKIEYVFDENDSHKIIEWVVTSADGVRYFYSDDETSNYLTTNTSHSTTQKKYTSSWYLSRIVAADGTDSIIFEYENYANRYALNQSETKSEVLYVGDMEALDKYLISNDSKIQDLETESHYRHSLSFYDGKRIKNIISSKGRMEFEYNDIRCDINKGSGLESIRIYGYENNLIKNFIMHQSYFASDEDNLPCENEEDKEKFRLRLDSISEYSPNCSFRGPYKFEYEESIKLPGRFSKAQDHWGYYNGKDDNESLLQPISIFTGGDREPNSETMRAGILKKIIYPKGGYTEFEFEPHQAFQKVDIDYNKLEESQEFEVVADNTNLPDSFVQTPFTVTGGTPVSLNLSGQLICPPDENPIIAAVRIKELGSNTVIKSITSEENTDFTEDINLLPGNYLLTAGGLGGGKATVKANWQEYQYDTVYNPINKLIGGIRIKKITVYDGIDHANDLIKLYEYTNENDPDKSSGASLATPSYHYLRSSSFGDSSITYLIRTSSSLAPLTTTAGSHVGYNTVTVRYGENGEGGKEIMNYFSPREFPDIHSGSSFPYNPPTSMEYKRGLLTAKKVYDKSGTLLKSITQSWGFDGNENPSGTGDKPIIDTIGCFFCDLSESRGFIRGLKVGIVRQDQVAGSSKPYPFTKYVYTYYGTIISSRYLKNKTERVYNPENPEAYTETTTDFYYDNPDHMLATRIRTVNSTNDTLITVNAYPTDYDTTNAGDDITKALAKLQEKHIHSPVIEKQIWKRKAGSSDSVLLAASLSEFKVYSDKVYPYRGLAIKKNQPLTDFQPAKTNEGNFTFDNRYEPVSVIGAYDDYGHPVWTYKPGETGAYTIWGHSGNLPVALVGGAKTQQTAHTSFEDEGAGWDFNPENIESGKAKTGEKYLALEESCSMTSKVINDTYVFSFWVKGNGNLSVTAEQTDNFNINSSEWEYKEITCKLDLNSPVKLEGSGVKIDELRLHPADAVMTTTTHKPLIGKTSETDARGQTAYYEYDDLGRLTVTRDHFGNIRQRTQLKEITQDKRLFAKFIANPQEIEWGNPISFDASSSCNYTPETIFRWDFGDGKTFESNNPFTEYDYDQPGIYTVTLELEKPNYPPHSVSKKVNVFVHKFVVNPEPGIYNEPVTFDASANTGVTEFQWDFGDGKTVKGPNATVQHVYKDTKSYKVKLKMIKPNHSPVEMQKNIHIESHPIEVLWGVKPSFTLCGSTVNFNLVAIGGIPPYTYEWEIKYWQPFVPKPLWVWQDLGGNWPQNEAFANLPFNIRCTIIDSKDKKFTTPIHFTNVPDSPYYTCEELPCEECLAP